MSNEIEKDAAAVSAAVTGPQTPNAVRVKRPARAALWAQLGALTVSAAAVGAIIYSLGWGSWSPVEAVMLARLHPLGIMGYIALVGVVAIALSLVWATVSASAGPGHIELGRAPGDDPGAR